MARPLRIEYPGAIYHVLSSGDRRDAIFRTEADRKLFLNLLDRTYLPFADPIRHLVDDLARPSRETGR